MAQDPAEDPPAYGENKLRCYFRGLGTLAQRRLTQSTYTIRKEVNLIHRLSAVRSSLGVRWSHFILNPFGILVLLTYYKSLILG